MTSKLPAPLPCPCGSTDIVTAPYEDNPHWGMVMCVGCDMRMNTGRTWNDLSPDAEWRIRSLKMWNKHKDQFFDMCVYPVSKDGEVVE